MYTVHRIPKPKRKIFAVFDRDGDPMATFVAFFVVALIITALALALCDRRERLKREQKAAEVAR